MKFYQIKGLKRFVGRKIELQTLAKLSAKAEASLLIVYGRRRIGKTALIEKAFEKNSLLKFEGLEEGGQGVQIQHFMDTLSNILAVFIVMFSMRMFSILLNKTNKV